VPGFQGWDALETFQRPVFYRVRSDIRARLELKVRHFPTKDGAVCGYLKAGMVVEVRAVFGCWLQVKYEDYEAAWVVHTTGGGASLDSPTKPRPVESRQQDSRGSAPAKMSGRSLPRTAASAAGQRPQSSAASSGKLDALNAALKETRIATVSSGTGLFALITVRI
jgi:hypothetical protein